ncbi:RecQ family zinc-binding domain-containing protein [Sphingobacterium sp. T2]|uniref:RecQ family zinc-binding domain-containing protein n=1 Tax=Sphingobacterium sp. T2 TaxID=1590596 RepID=UPI00057B982E|nr:RecQ family zinc-binding domain-containing protein [Sphingobacterium sp. T2]
MQPRVDYKNLYIDTEFIRERKQVKGEQIQAIYRFLDTKACRSKAILYYFGEENSTYCGECDLCLRRKHLATIEAKIEQEIRVLLMEKSLELHELIDNLTVGSDEQKLKVLRTLTDEGKVAIQDGKQYHWMAN